MKTHVFFSAFALLLAGSACATCQTKTASADACDPTKPLKITDLADNANAQSAARNLGNQIVGQYGDFLKNHPGSAIGFKPDIGAFTYDFDATILSILSEPQLCGAVQKAVANTGAAIATTSQTNKQNGASSTASGTTSVTEKTAVTQLLGIAVQDGAINNNVTGNTMTLSTSAYGFVTGFGWIKDTAKDYDTWGLFSRLGASATFNLTNASGSSSSSSASSASDTLASANHRQVSQWEIKFAFKDTSIRSKAVTDIFEGRSTSIGNGTATSLKKAIVRAQAKTTDPNVKSQSLQVASQAVANDLSSRQMAVILQPLELLYAPDSRTGAPSDATSSMWKSVGAEVVKLKNPAADCSGQNTTAPDPCLALEQAILKWVASYKPSGAGALIYESVAADASNDPSVQKVIAQYASDQASALVADKQFEADVKNLQAGWNAALTFTEQYPATGATTTTTTTSSSTATSTKPSQPAYLVSGLDISWQKKKSNSAGSPAAPGTGTDAGGAENSKDSTDASPWPSWTLNLAGSVYPNPNAALNEQTFRGGTAATTFQWDLGKSPFLGKTADKSQITLELSGQYQRLQENAGQSGKKADLALGNLKLEFPISSGVSFPFSMTVANSSEQIKETYVKGNFGVSFDLDKLASLLKANQ
jgi:hypothetical protein